MNASREAAKPRRGDKEAELPKFPLRVFASSRETDPIRNRLLRLTAGSPDLLAIIKQEGRV